MRLDMIQHMRTDMRQELRLAPQIIQSIEILQLPMTELLQEIKSQLEANPVLEEVPPAEPATEGDVKSATASPTDNRSEEMETQAAARADSWDYESVPRRRGSDGGEDKKMEAMNNTASRPQSLQDHLFEQFTLQDIDGETQEIGEAVIYNLNDDGYLQYPLADIVATLGHDVTLERAEAVLKRIQQLDPPGVGARDLRECLLLQLGDGDAYQFERLLVMNHLEDIEKNKLPKICKDTGRSMEDLKEALHLLSHLDPKPGRLFSREEPHYIVPDITVEQIDGQYMVFMDDRLLPALEINQRYKNMLQTTEDKNTREFIRGKIEAAKWLIDSIQQRKQTIRRVAEAIVRYQQPFLEQGIAALRPLKMQEIADELGIHVSTVSRAVGGKYMQTPQGILPLKFFFTGGMLSQEEIGGDSTNMSILAVQQRVKQMVDQEDTVNPLSDDDIMNRLKAEGLGIARRTITKYRKAMNIPSSRQRRQY